MWATSCTRARPPPPTRRLTPSSETRCDFDPDATRVWLVRYQGEVDMLDSKAGGFEDVGTLIALALCRLGTLQI